MKFLKFLKKHIFIIIILIILVVLGIVAYFTLKDLLLPDDKDSEYGDRLEGIDEVPVTSDIISTIKETALANDFIGITTVQTTGKIINISVSLNSEVGYVDSKSAVEALIPLIPEDVVSYYDIQVFITLNTEDESELYPTIGYKNNDSNSIVWNN